MQAAAIREEFPVLAKKTPSGAPEGREACTCSDHGHRAKMGLLGCAGCPCDYSVGSMMLASDDPLRDTPEKAEAYAQRIAALKLSLAQARIEGWNDLPAANDIRASLRILGADAS